MNAAKSGWTSGACSIHWQLIGKAPRTLLMLHEMGGSLHSFDAVVELLDDGLFSLLRLDQRGFGASEKPRSPYRFSDLAEDVAAVLRESEVEGAVGFIAVAGACPIAVDFATRFPERTSGLRLCAPSLDIPPQARAAALERSERMMGTAIRDSLDATMGALYPPVLRGPAYDTYRARYLATDPVGMALASRAFAEHEVQLNLVQCPVLLLAGKHDVRPVSAALELAARFRSAEAVVVESAGHVFAVQAPEEVARHARIFFSRLASHLHSEAQRR
jgi:3-oxoadipate enol-lactonase